MTPQHSLTLGFAFLYALGVTALPSLGPTRTTPPHRTFVLAAQAQSSSTTTAPKGTHKNPVDTATTIVTISLWALLFGILIADHFGVWDHVRKVLYKRSLGQNPAPLSPSSTTLPTLDHHGVSTGAPANNNNAIYGELDGWTPPAGLEEVVPREIIAGYIHPQSRSPSATPAHTDSTPVNPTSTPHHPEQPQNADSGKEGTVTGATTEGRKQ